MSFSHQSRSAGPQSSILKAFIIDTKENKYSGDALNYPAFAQHLRTHAGTLQRGSDILDPTFQPPEANPNTVARVRVLEDETNNYQDPVGGSAESHKSFTLPSNPAPQSSSSSSSASSSSSLVDVDDIDLHYEDIAFSSDNNVYVYKIVDINAELEELKNNTLYQDGTGPYPTTADSGAKLIIVFFHQGYLHLEAITTPSGAQIVKATENTTDYLLKRNTEVTHFVLDNTCPEQVKDMFRKRRIPFQLVAPRNHAWNRAEYGVNIVKSRMVTMRAGIDPLFDFSRHWDKLLPRLEININVSLPSPRNPKISVWEALHGKPYDFASHPLIPPACVCMVHVPRDDRASWSDRSVQAFGMEPSFLHYRCQVFYTPSTNAYRINSSYSVQAMSPVTTTWNDSRRPCLKSNCV